jgi:hypothetical protein
VSGDSPVPTRPPGTCAECRSPLADDQRYCLSCGARNGLRAPALERILEGLGSGGQAPSALPPVKRSRNRLPSPLTAAVLTLAMLGFGTVTGAAASNPSGALNALRRGPLTLLIPAPPASTPLAAAPPPAEATPTPEASPSSSAEEPKSSSEESSSSSGAGHKHSSKGASKGSRSGSGGEAPKLPPVKHVFLIVLADQAYAQTFGPESPAPYIAHTLERRGELLVRFYGVAHEELADEVALISGLGPTPQTAADCPTFSDIVPGQANSKGQYTGQGCIYPKEAQTVGEQLTAKGFTWKVYAEGLGDVSGGAAEPVAGGSSGVGGAGGSKSVACWHPEFGAPDTTSQAPQGDTFATFRDPFTYFDGVLHSPECARDDVGIEGLAGDLKSAKSTPALSYIVPDLCHDGRPTPCGPGAPSGLPAAETFLRRVVPEILASPAYHKGGLLIITTDQAPTTGEYADSSSCCMQPRFPAPAAASTPVGTTNAATATPTTPAAATPATGTPTTTGTATTTPPPSSPTTTTPAATTPAATTPAVTTPAPATPGIDLPPKGGGQVGALLISPYVKPATFDQEPFNDFSLLRTIENLFGLPPLGYAATRGLSSLEASVFSAWSGAPANSS